MILSPNRACFCPPVARLLEGRYPAAMVKLAYAAAATCKLSGVHTTNPADGRCVTCGETIFIPVAYEAVSTAKKKGGPRKALPTTH